MVLHRGFFFLSSDALIESGSPKTVYPDGFNGLASLFFLPFAMPCPGLPVPSLWPERSLYPCDSRRDDIIVVNISIIHVMIKASPCSSSNDNNDSKSDSIRYDTLPVTCQTCQACCPISPISYLSMIQDPIAERSYIKSFRSLGVFEHHSENILHHHHPHHHHPHRSPSPSPWHPIEHLKPVMSFDRSATL